jgi:uncharacterized protein (DUF58 family)
MRKDRSAASLLPCPGVAFDVGFVARIERFSARMSAARERREALGARAHALGGHEFVGYRAYHAGDDPRQIDWNALARLDRVLVRVTRREAGERWLVVVDASASMGAGPPGKLQRAAECAAALTALAIRSGARARIVAIPGAIPRANPRAVSAADMVRDAQATVGATRSRGTWIEIDRRARLPQALAFLSDLRAEGRATRADLAAAVERSRDVARLFVISDLTSFEPSDVIRAASARRRTSAFRILAPHELGLAADGRVEWVDPEDGARLDVEIDAGARGRYEVELGAELERWRRACARAGVTHAVHASTSAFEDVLAGSLTP